MSETFRLTDIKIETEKGRQTDTQKRIDVWEKCIERSESSKRQKKIYRQIETDRLRIILENERQKERQRAKKFADCHSHIYTIKGRFGDITSSKRENDKKTKEQRQTEKETETERDRDRNRE